jgi:hypothetical protein
MTTADWALVISIASASISLAGFIWNIWSKFIYPKPKVRVSFAMITVIEQGADEMPEALRLTATNMGPVEVKITSAMILVRPFLFKAPHYGLLSVFPDVPGGAERAGSFRPLPPTKLSVGESISVYLMPDHDALAKGDYERIGFGDSFGQNHWAPRRDIIEALRYVRAACEKAGKDWRSPRR